MKKGIFIFCFIIVVLSLIALINRNRYKEVSNNYYTQAVSAKVIRNKINLKDSLDINNVKVISHRGQIFGEPENSLKAIESSIRYKVNFAEIDVQETSDGVVVLMHDRSLKRLTGLNKNVDQLTFNQIEKLNLASSTEHDIERVPTLDEVIRKSKGRLKLLIEIKPYAKTVDLTNKVVKIIDDNKFTNQCEIHSLSYKILLDVKKLNPNILTGYIISKPIKNLTSLNVNFYSVQEKCITRKMINDIHSKNKEIYAWTVDKKSDINNLINLNVDGIISNKPRLIFNVQKTRRLIDFYNQLNKDVPIANF